MTLGVCELTITESNKSTNQMHKSLRFIARRSNTAQHVCDNDTATTMFQR